MRGHCFRHNRKAIDTRYGRYARYVLAAGTGAVAAAALAGCGSGGGGGSATIAPAHRGAASATATPTATTESQAGKPLSLDPSVALPADLTVDFDWTMPRDPARYAALTAVADYLQAIDHAVVAQSAQDPPLHAYGSGDALAYARDYVRRSVAAKLTITGADRFYRPQFVDGGGGSGTKGGGDDGDDGSVEVRFCENQSKLYSKETATGKVHVTGTSARDYVLYDVAVVKLPVAHPYWQVQGITVKEGAGSCEQ